jgi:hypothetical protein
MKNKFILLGALALFSSSVLAQDLEVLCSKALLTEMQKQKLITNSSGVCLQSLNDLPQVTIGLGSSVYSSGVASGKSLGNEDEKIKAVSEILTGETLAKSKFEIHGYADGENNTIPSYTDKFLGTKTTFTKSDIRTQIKDANTRSKILELLNEVDDKQDITPVKSTGSGASFKPQRLGRLQRCTDSTFWQSVFETQRAPNCHGQFTKNPTALATLDLGSNGQGAIL